MTIINNNNPWKFFIQSYKDTKKYIQKKPLSAIFDVTTTFLNCIIPLQWMEDGGRGVSSHLVRKHVTKEEKFDAEIVIILLPLQMVDHVKVKTHRVRPVT